MYVKTLKNIVQATGAVAAVLTMAPVLGGVGVLSVGGFAIAAACGVAAGVADHFAGDK